MAKKNGKPDLHEDLQKLLAVQKKSLDVQRAILSSQEGLRGDVDGLRGDVQSLQKGQEGLRSDVQALQVGQEGLRGDVRALQVGQEGLRSDVQALRVGQEQVWNELHALGEGQTELRGDVQTLTRIVARRSVVPDAPVVGDIVQILEQPGEWLPAVVVRIHEAGSVDLEVFGLPAGVDEIRTDVRLGEGVGQWRWKPLEAPLLRGGD